MKKISVKQKTVLIISGLFLCAVLLEIGLRIGGFVYLSLQEHRNRISIRREGSYRILCLGDSVTAGGYPGRLEEVLNQRDIGIRFCAINKGIPGADTRAVVSQLEDNLNTYNPDMVIIMVGINDVEIYKACEDTLPKESSNFLKSFRTYKLVKLLRLHVINKTKETKAYKPGEKSITAKTDDLNQPSSFKRREKMHEKTTEISWENYKKYAKLAWQHRRQGRNDKAKEMFKELEINPINDSRHFAILGDWYLAEARYDEAEQMFKKVIEARPENVYQTYGQLGLCYWNKRKYDKAEQAFKKAIEINPEDNRAYFELGELYRKLGKYDKAEEILKKGVTIDPENDRLCSGLGVLYGELGKDKSSEEFFRKANIARLKYYNSDTQRSYRRLKEIVTRRGIKLLSVQYPMRGVEPLKKMLEPHENVIFVDNEIVFKKAVKQKGYDEYFVNCFAGDFGHCTRRGNSLLAENIANVILKKCFNKL